jgi:hypothetical protein
VHAKGRPALVIDGEQVEAQIRRVADEQRQAACDDYRLEGEDDLVDQLLAYERSIQMRPAGKQRRRGATYGKLGQSLLR